MTPPHPLVLLRRPGTGLLPAYLDALDRGWSPGMDDGSAARERARIGADPQGFLAGLDDAGGIGPPVRLPDGSEAPALPRLVRWVWSDGFAGTVSLRWQPGTADLPPQWLGHVGYMIVPWRRGEGLATAGLLALLPQARSVGLPHVDLVMRAGNAASRRVAEKAGGALVGSFPVPQAFGGWDAVRYRIALESG